MAARVDAVLYSIKPNGFLGDCTVLNFSSRENEPTTYYFYNAQHSSSFHVSRVIESQPFSAKLVLYQDILLLEASLPSVSVKTNTWSTQGSELSFVNIPVSDQSKDETVRYILRPNDCFQIDRRQFTLQARQTAVNQEIQVTSSRPDEVDSVDQQQAVKSSNPTSMIRPSTPVLGSGVAVMETPMTDRHQAPLHNAKRSVTRSASPAPTRRQAVTDGHSNGKPLETCENPLEGKSGNRGLGKPLEERFTSPDDRDQLSSSTSSQGDKVRQPRKRSASSNKNSNGLEVGVPNTFDLESAPIADEISDLDAPRKRQKRNVSSRAVPKGSEESQNSVMSTIHVEVPDNAQEVTKPKTGGNPHTCPQCGRTFLKAAALTQHLKRAKGCAKLSSNLGGNEPEKKSSLTPIAESKTCPTPENEQSLGSPEISPSKGNSKPTPSDHPSPTEPPSSNRSTRSRAQERREQDLSQDSPDPITRVYYTSSTKVEESTIYTRFLRQHNIKPVKSVVECDILCTGKGELKRTSNLILAVLMGKEVVTDQWVIQSAKKQQMLDTAEFIPESDAREREWGTTLSAAIKRGREGLKPLEGWTINFTPSLKNELGKSWTELKGLCLAAGATVHAMIPRKPPSETDSMVVIAASHEPDLSTLEERGWNKVFTKDIITYSVLRGAIDTESDEFVMKPVKKGNAGGKRKK